MLIVGMELADRSLWDRFIEAEDQGLRGIPRSELLGYLWDVASGIDHLNEPRHTLGGGPASGSSIATSSRRTSCSSAAVQGGRLRQAQVMDGPVARNRGTWTLSYAAPEFFEGWTSHRSDQYALAVTYCQLRGGRLPSFGTDVAVAAGHLLGTPDLDGLPEAERPILARALAKRPEDRWPDCTAMIGALRRRDGGRPVGPRDAARPDRPATISDPEGRRAPGSSRVRRHPWIRTAVGRSRDRRRRVVGRRFRTALARPGRRLPQRADDFGLTARAGRGADDDGGGRPGGLRDPGRPLTADPGHSGRGRAPDGRPLAGRDRGADLGGGLRRNSPTHGRDLSRPRPGQARAHPGPAKIAHEVLRPPPVVQSTIEKVPRPPKIVTSTVAGGADAGSIPPDRPAPRPTSPASGLAIEPARSDTRCRQGPLGSTTSRCLPPPRNSRWRPAPARPSPCPRAGGPRSPGRATGSVTGRSCRPDDRPSNCPREVRVRAGETTKFRVRVDRGGGSGPAVLRFAGISRGVSVDGPAIPADAQETEVVVSAAPDAPPSVADVGVSAEVGDRRAEARVRLRVLPSAASEAYARGRELLARGEQARASAEFSQAIKARSRACLGVLLPGHRRPHGRASAQGAGRLHRGDPAQAGHRHRVRGPGPDSLETGDLTRALADYTKAIQLKPDNPITRGARGRIYAELGQYDRALADYTEVIRLKPESAEARYRRGQIRYIFGRQRRGGRGLQRGDPARPDLRLGLSASGRCLREAGQPGTRRRRSRDGRPARPALRPDPVYLRDALHRAAPPAAKSKTGDRAGAAPSGPVLRRPARRATAIDAPADPR